VSSTTTIEQPQAEVNYYTRSHSCDVAESVA
jgi:hypothetical protein